jgi:hypothetical protein
MPLRGLRRGTAAGQRAPAFESEGQHVIPRHELPGRIVLSLGLFTR